MIFDLSYLRLELVCVLAQLARLMQVKQVSLFAGVLLVKHQSFYSEKQFRFEFVVDRFELLLHLLVVGLDNGDQKIEADHNDKVRTDEIRNKPCDFILVILLLAGVLAED